MCSSRVKQHSEITPRFLHFGVTDRDSSQVSIQMKCKYTSVCRKSAKDVILHTFSSPTVMSPTDMLLLVVGSSI